MSSRTSKSKLNPKPKQSQPSPVSLLYRFLDSSTPKWRGEPAPATFATARKGTTQDWANSNLDSVSLAENMTRFEGNKDFWMFKEAVSNDFTDYPHLANFEDNSLYRALTVDTPAGEADVNTAVMQIFLQPIFHTMRMSPIYNQQGAVGTKGPLTLHLQLVSESYTRQRSGETSTSSDLAEAFKSVTVIPPDEDANEPGEASTPEPVNLPGVRTDHLFGFRLEYDVDHPEITKIVEFLARDEVDPDERKMATRANKKAKERAALAKMHTWEKDAKHLYMPHDQIQVWTFSSNELKATKTITAVELKNLGHLKPEAVKDFAKSSLKLDGQKITTGYHQYQSYFPGLLSIFQQACRYAYCYGSRYVYLTDYATHIAIEVTPLLNHLKDPAKFPDVPKLTWYMADQDKGRWLLAWILWQEATAIRKGFQESYENDLQMAKRQLPKDTSSGALPTGRKGSSK